MVGDVGLDAGRAGAECGREWRELEPLFERAVEAQAAMIDDPLIAAYAKAHLARQLQLCIVAISQMRNPGAPHPLHEVLAERRRERLRAARDVGVDGHIPTADAPAPGPGLG